MKLLIISQRAKSNSNFKLNDLTGHGRIDVIIRCILAAYRPILDFPIEFDGVYCFLKGDLENPGWLHWNTQLSNQDEISMAETLKKDWETLFTYGSLKQLIAKLNPTKVVLLTEGGNKFTSALLKNSDNLVFVLGAQADLTEEDMEIISIKERISLSNDQMLASHVIIKLRQKINQIVSITSKP